MKKRIGNKNEKDISCKKQNYKGYNSRNNINSILIK